MYPMNMRLRLLRRSQDAFTSWLLFRNGPRYEDLKIPFSARTRSFVYVLLSPRQPDAGLFGWPTGPTSGITRPNTSLAVAVGSCQQDF